MSRLPPSSSARPRRPRAGLRTLRRALVLVALALLVAGLALRPHLEDWLVDELTRRLARDFGLRARFGRVEVSLLRLRLEVSDAVLERESTQPGRLEIEVPYARLDLGWRALVAARRGRIRLDRLLVDRPRVRTDGTWLHRAERAAAPHETAPLDFAAGHLRITGGSWTHADTTVPLDLDVSGVELRATLGSDGRTMLGDAHANATLRAPPLDAPLEARVSTQFRLRGEHLDLLDLEAHAGPVELAAEAKVELGGPPSVEGQARLRLDLDGVSRLLRPGAGDLAGKLAGTLHVRAGGRPFLAQGAVEGTAVRLGPVRASRFTGQLALAPDRLTLSSIEAALLGGIARGQLALDLPGGHHASAEVVLDNLDAGRLLDWLGVPIPLRGRTGARVALEGDPLRRGSWSGSGTFELQDTGGETGEVPASASGRFSIEAGQLALDAADVRTEATAFAVAATADLAERRVRGRVTIHGTTSDAGRTQADVLRILAGAGAATPEVVRRALRGAGTFAARFAFGGATDLELDLDLTDGVWGPQSFDQARLRLASRAGELDIRELDLTSGSAVARGSLRIRFEPYSIEEVALEASAIEVADLAALFDVETDLRGRLSGTLRAARRAGQRDGAGTLRLVSGSWLGEPFDEATSTIRVSGDTLQFVDARVVGPAVELRGAGSVDLPSGTAEARVEAGRVHLERLAAAVRGSAPFAAEVQVSGPVRVDETGTSGLLEVQSADVRIRDESIGSVAGQIELRPQDVVLRLRGVEPTGWAGTATVGLAPPHPLQAELVLDGWQAERTADLPLPVNWVASGRLAATGPAGDPAQWRVEGAIATAEIHVGARTFQLASAAPLHMEHGTIEVGPLRLEGSEVDISARGRYTLESGEMDGSFAGTGDLTLLALLVPELRAQGAVRFDIRARGTLASPELEGQLRLEDGRLRHLALPYRLQAVAASVALRGSSAEIESFHAVLGGGEVEGSGRVELGGTEPLSFALALHAAGVRLAIPEGFEGIYDAALQIHGTSERLDVSGRADLLRGLWSSDFERPQLFGAPTREHAPGETTYLGPRTFLDLDVVATDNVWVRNRLAEIESAVDLHVGGTLERPQVTGRVFALEGGRIDYRGLRYQVRSGALEFTNPDRIEPFVAIEAETSIAGYDIQLRASGTPDKLSYDLTSSPVLSSQDIIALLATGKTLSDVEHGSTTSSEFTGDAAANYFAGVLTDPFEDELAGLVGLDTIRIDPLLLGREDPTTRITLGKEIRDDVTVVYSHRADQVEEDLYQVEWRVNRRATLTVERSTNGGVGSTAYYTHRYWWRKPVPGAQVSAPGEPARSEEQGPTVHSVRVLDELGHELDDLAQRIPLSAGERYRRADLFQGVEILRRTLVRRGNLEVEVDAEATPAASNTVDMTYRVRPGPTYRVELVGVSRKDEKKLLQALDRLWSDALFVGDLYADSVEAIRAYFQDHGYFAVDVEHVLVSGDEPILRFQIDRGSEVKVGRVTILGATAVGDERVRRQMLTRPPGLFGSRSFVPSVLEADLAAIRNLYRSLGYLGIRIQPPEVRLSTAGDTVDVALVLDEGPLFTIRRLEFPDTPEISRQELERWSGLHVGAPVTGEGLVDAEGALRRELDRSGRAGATVRLVPAFSTDGSVDVRFEVEPGPEMRIAEIRVEGNFLTRERTILEALDMRVGDRVTREDMARGQRALYRLGTLQSVRVENEPAATGPDGARIVRVRVTESRPLRVALGAGYNTESKVNLSLGTSFDNVAGRARSLGTRVVLNDELRNFQVFARSPTLFGYRIPAVANVVWEEDRQTPGFVVRQWSTALRVDRQFSPRWRGYARYAYQIQDVFDITDPVAVQQERLEDARLGNVEASAVYDTRDDTIAPSRGWRIGLGAAVFAPPLLSDFSFLRGTAEASRMWTLRNRVALVSVVRIGAQNPFGSTTDVPISERFFAGGSSTVRGFDTDLLGPIADGLPTGGEGLFLLNEEVRFPIIAAFHGVAFYDAGNVYRTLPDFDPFELRHVLGAGIRLETPIGPLRAEYGWKLDREPGESAGQFFFSIGNAF